MIEMLVLASTYREVFTLIFVLIGLWPLFEARFRGETILQTLWFCSSSLTAVFPLLSTKLSNNINLVTTGVVLCVLLSVLFLVHSKELGSRKDIQIHCFQTLLIGVSGTSVFFCQQSLDNREGLPILYQFLNWMLLIVCPVIPMVFKHEVVIAFCLSCSF
jgi:phosphatidylinositol glycan class N